MKLLIEQKCGCGVLNLVKFEDFIKTESIIGWDCNSKSNTEVIPEYEV